jgi:hypothetical protein
MPIRRRAIRRSTYLRTATTAAILAAASVAGAAGASAEQVPVLVAQHGSHSVYLATGEEYVVENPQTYWDFVPLDGMCGFAGSALTLSEMDETFFIQSKENGAKAGSFTGTGKILDESFTLVQYDEGGRAVRTFTGTGDEYAQMRGSGAAGPMADQSVNLRVRFRGESADGHDLAFSLKLRMRTDAQTGEVTKFEAAVDQCHVR